MNIEGYNFLGPYIFGSINFKSLPVVYVITDENNNPIDVGEIGDLKQRMFSHEREFCWRRNVKGKIWLYVLQENSENNRLAIEKIIRDKYSFVCGVR